MEHIQEIQPAPSGHGGARPGAGRPPGPDRYPRIPAAMRASFEARFKREMRAFFGDFLKSYKAAIKAGDSKILVDAANRLMGRPVTSVELSGPGGQPVRIQAAAAVALALSDPAQMDALAAFSRTLALPEEGDDQDDDQDIAGELVEGEPVDVQAEAPQTIISRPVGGESSQVPQPIEVSSIADDVADWLEKG